MQCWVSFYLPHLNSVAMLDFFLSSNIFFMLPTLMNLWTAYLPPSCSPLALDFQLKPILMLFRSLMQESIRIFIPLYVLLVNSGGSLLAFTWISFCVQLELLQEWRTETPLLLLLTYFGHSLYLCGSSHSDLF